MSERSNMASTQQPAVHATLSCIIWTLASLSSLGSARSSVAATPYFTSHPQQLTTIQGEDAVFTCTVYSLETRPGSAVFWSRGYAILSMNGVVFSSPSDTLAGRITVSVEDGGSQFKLTLRSVTVDDQGDYTCQVAGVETLVQTNTLTVLVPPRISSFSPDQLRYEVLEYSDLRMECTATGQPDAQVVWTRRVVGNDDSDDSDQDTSSIDSDESNDVDNEDIVSRGNSLNLASLKRRESGRYTCNAVNDAGSDKRHIYVTVSYEPTFIEGTSRQHVGFGMTARLQCQFDASEPVDVFWLHNGEEIDSIRTNIAFSREAVTSTAGQLTALLTFDDVGLDDVGTYTCVVNNTAGRVSHDVLVTGVPSSVAIVEEPTSDVHHCDQYTLQWSVESLSPVTSYNLFITTVTQDEENYSADNDEVQLEIPSSSVMTPFTYVITDLVPNTEYNVQLQAVNVFGPSDRSNMFNFTTNSYCPTTTITTTISKVKDNHKERDVDNPYYSAVDAKAVFANAVSSNVFPSNWTYCWLLTFSAIVSVKFF